MAVGARIVHRPTGVASGPVVDRMVAAVARSGVHEAAEDPLGRPVIVGWKGESVILEAGVLAPLALYGRQHPYCRESQGQAADPNRACTERHCPFRCIITRVCSGILKGPGEVDDILRDVIL